ncbi:DUF4062 domain-containing protein [Bacteroides ihuae]|uniref:DUF4062 domain-containing protein n=1 Tax=Bacteroides ihuae TaxID=1852362 RepID=UPI0008DABBEB|nr:DUF4062 domain-containing protein [Bacteroides ihuae]
MEKKYQVFISSTYQDLIEERQKVIEALLGKNCFPVGMEYFPAANDDQFTVIKKLIDRCDYYILIIGGRYGSIESKSGKSYTQLEFEYAISENIPIASFYHAEPIKLPGDKLENTDTGKEKLESFRKIVQTKLCDSWKEPYELAFKVNKSLDYLFENSPRVGWVKADEISSAEANKEILVLRKENDELKALLAKDKESKPEGIEKLQQGDDEISIRLKYYYDGDKINPVNTTWNIITSVLAPLMIDECSEDNLSKNLALFLWPELCRICMVEPSNYSIFNDDFQTIKVQLIALNIIKMSERKKTAKDTETYWTLTPYGNRLMMKLKALKR